jgi:predicted kinase
MHVNKSIIISGPTGSGKSTLIGKLKENAIPLISEQLGLENTSSWVYIMNEFKIPNLLESHVDKLLFHYDFLQPLARKQIQNYEEDECLGVLFNSDKITFVTLWTQPEILLERIKLKRKQILNENLNPQGCIKFLKSKNKAQILSKLLTRYILLGPTKIEDLYNSPFVYDTYEKWFDFCSSLNGSENWIVDNSGAKLKLLAQSKWQDIIEYKN